MTSSQAAQTYHKIQNRIFYISLLLDLCLLSVFQLSGMSLKMRAYFSSFTPSFLLVNALYLAFLGMGFYLIHFPLSYFLGYAWEHRFDLSNQSRIGWFVDNVKKNLLSAAIMLILIEAVYLFLKGYPEAWWLGAGAVWFFMSVFLARVMPNFIIPLFFKYTKIEDEELRRSIISLFKQCDVALQDIFAIDLSSKSKKANAFICGFGKTRRVVLSDTLIGNFTQEEIEAVVAHELGHFKNKDILKSIMINTTVIFFSFFIIDKVLKAALLKLGGLIIYDIAAFPVFAISMMLLSLFMMPALNAYSRLMEVAADRFSIELTKAPDAFISMIDKLGQMNLAEYEPSRFNEIMFYDHPPIAKRIRFARSMKTSL